MPTCPDCGLNESMSFLDHHNCNPPRLNLSHIPGPYRIQYEKDKSWSVYQPNGTIIANCVLKETAGIAANALNACPILPILRQE